MFEFEELVAQKNYHKAAFFNKRDLVYCEKYFVSTKDNNFEFVTEKTFNAKSVSDSNLYSFNFFNSFLKLYRKFLKAVALNVTENNLWILRISFLMAILYKNTK